MSKMLTGDGAAATRMNEINSELEKCREKMEKLSIV